MEEELKFKDPYLVAVWPGMGQVALTAGYYLMAKLGMHELAEFPAESLFDVDYVSVEHGLIKKPQRPRNRFFVWENPDKGRDVIVFVGEVQPPLGKYEFCEKLLDFAESVGVSQVFTFAALSSQIKQGMGCKTFAAATQSNLIDDLVIQGVDLFKGGHIGGMNGILLGAAAARNLPGICLLGELPHAFTQITYPTSSLVVLETFKQLTGLEIDMDELSQQASEFDEHLQHLLEQAHVEYRIEEEPSQEFAEEEIQELPSTGSLTQEEQANVDKLFAEAKNDRSKAYELKRELDRLHVFSRYENQFLDLFRKENT